VLSATAILGIPFFWIAAPILGILAVRFDWFNATPSGDLRAASVGYLAAMVVWWAIGVLATPTLTALTCSIVNGPIEPRRAGLFGLAAYGAFSIYGLIFLLIMGDW
jgi:hypothetical protein